MKLETRQYRVESGWDKELPELDSNRTLVLLFGAPEFGSDTQAIQQVIEAFPNSIILGCSTSGEIFDTELFDHSLSVSIAKFDRSEISLKTAEISSIEESEAVGRKLAGELLRDDLRGIFVLSDGLNINGTSLVNGFNDALPAQVVVTGGLAGDGTEFSKTWIVAGSKIRDRAVVAVGFYGDHVKIGHGSKGGWDPFGVERTITKSTGNVLFELDGQPALELYKTYLGERAAELPGSALLFPLSMRVNNSDEKESVVRTILSVDENENSMTFAGDLPQGSKVTLMRANLDRLVEGAEKAALAATQEINSAMLSIAISCVGRRLVLGESTEEELESTLHVLPEGTRQVGFYSYGEISPLVAGKGCDLHNQTMTLTTISEDE